MDQAGQAFRIVHVVFGNQHLNPVFCGIDPFEFIVRQLVIPFPAVSRVNLVEGPGQVGIDLGNIFERGRIVGVQKPVNRIHDFACSAQVGEGHGIGIFVRCPHLALGGYAVQAACVVEGTGLETFFVFLAEIFRNIILKSERKQFGCLRLTAPEPEVCHAVNKMHIAEITADILGGRARRNLGNAV